MSELKKERIAYVKKKMAEIELETGLTRKRIIEYALYEEEEKE